MNDTAETTKPAKKLKLTGRGGPGRGQGRKPGPNSKTLERRKAAEYADIITKDHSRIPGALKPGESRPKLAKDVLEEFMLYFASAAAVYQPFNPDGTPRPEGNAAEFQKNAILAVDAATRLAPFQSPRYAAIAVSQVPPGSRDAQLAELSPRARIDIMLRDIADRITPSLAKPPITIDN